MSDAIHAPLLCKGQLGSETVTATVLKPRGLSGAKAGCATSYTPGGIVTFRQQARSRPQPGIGYCVETVDAEAGTVRLVPPRAGRTTGNALVGGWPRRTFFAAWPAPLALGGVDKLVDR